MIHHNRFDTIPAINEKRAAVRVTKAAERAIRTGHPWLYESGITSLAPEPNTGDLTIIFDSKRNFLAIGLYDHTSPIRIKIIHRGKPTPINGQFWQDKLTAAITHRASIHKDHTTQTTAYRLIHGENDGLPGLIVDRYEDTAVIKLYSAAWLPHLRAWTELLIETITPKRIILRLSRRLQGEETFGLNDGDVLVGERSVEPILFRENGLIFEADVIRGQKTGHFLDQRDNRQRVRAWVEERGANSVLDVFGCTGGFSVYAAAGGAKSVTTLDRSAFALAQAERNMAHNHLSAQHKTVCADAFTTLQEMADQKRRYDVVILDPPAFAQKQADVDNALNAYAKLARLGVSATKRHGLIVLASCSSRITADQFFTTIHDATGGRLQELTRTTHAIDHPITFPEGAYLKCLFATIS